jgi:hypothetical protein
VSPYPQHLAKSVTGHRATAKTMPQRVQGLGWSPPQLKSGEALPANCDSALASLLYHRSFILPA